MSLAEKGENIRVALGRVVLLLICLEISWHRFMVTLRYGRVYMIALKWSFWFRSFNNQHGTRNYELSKLRLTETDTTGSTDYSPGFAIIMVHFTRNVWAWTSSNLFKEMDDDHSQDEISKSRRLAEIWSGRIWVHHHSRQKRSDQLFSQRLSSSCISCRSRR